MSIAAHPGIANTNNPGKMERNLLMKVYKISFSYIIQPSAMGALPQIRASVDLNVKSGDIYGPGGVLELSGHPVLVQSKRTALDIENAQRLWKVSEKLTSVTFQ